MTFAEWWGTVHTEVTERMVGEELAEFVWLAQQKRIAELERDWDNIDALIDVKDKRIAELKYDNKWIADLFADSASTVEQRDKRIEELEAMIIRLHNTHPQDIAGMLEWWTDMFKLMPIKSEGGADIAESGEIDWSTMGDAAGTVKEGGGDE